MSFYLGNVKKNLHFLQKLHFYEYPDSPKRKAGKKDTQIRKANFQQASLMHTRTKATERLFLFTIDVHRV